LLGRLAVQSESTPARVLDRQRETFSRLALTDEEREEKVFASLWGEKREYFSLCGVTVMRALPQGFRKPRNLMIRLFSCTSCCIVVCATEKFEMWLGDLAIILAAMKQAVVAIVVARLDRCENPHLVAKQVSAEVRAVLVSKGLSGSQWSPQMHKGYPKEFRDRVCVLLLINNRLKGVVRMPKDIVFIICRFLSAFEMLDAPLVGLGAQHEVIVGPSLLDVMRNVPRSPLPEQQQDTSDCRVSLSNVYNVGGIGTVGVGRILKGITKPGISAKLVGDLDKSGSHENVASAKVFSVERHHMSVLGRPDMFVGFNFQHFASHLRLAPLGLVLTTFAEDVPALVQQFARFFFLQNVLSSFLMASQTRCFVLAFLWALLCLWWAVVPTCTRTARGLLRASFRVRLLAKPCYGWSGAVQS
jgi:hypothetical protein